jgi:hypothetical protein
MDVFLDRTILVSIAALIKRDAQEKLEGGTGCRIATGAGDKEKAPLAWQESLD